MFKRGYMINDIKMRLKMKTRSHRYNMTRTRPRHGHKYAIYKNMSQFNDGYMY